MKSRFSTSLLVLIALSIVLNIVGGEVIARLRLPVYGDSVGTVLAGALGGPIVGALTGGLTNLLWALVNAERMIAVPFGITAAVIGALAGWLTARGWMRSPARALASGLGTGLVAAIVSAPIAAYVFGGVTGGGTDLVVAFFRAAGANVLQAALGQGIVSDPLDKAVTFMLAWFILRSLPRRQLARYPGGAHFMSALDEPQPLDDAPQDGGWLTYVRAAALDEPQPLDDAPPFDDPRASG